MSTAHSTCLGFGWYTWVYGSLRGTAQTCAGSSVWDRGVKSSPGSTVNAIDLPVFMLFAATSTLRGTAGSPVALGSPGRFVCRTVVTTASAPVDTRAALGASSFTTALGRRPTLAVLPLMY